jgi:hypothetical protein
MFVVIKDLSAGTHVHVTPAGVGKFSLDQLKNIAFTLAYNEGIIREILTEERKNNRYCKINSKASQELYNLLHCRPSDLKDAITGLTNENSLISLMQSDDRQVLWNFQNTRPRGIGTIEFRGGRHMRGHVRTLRCIAFAISVIYMSLQEVNTP